MGRPNGAPEVRRSTRKQVVGDGTRSLLSALTGGLTLGLAVFLSGCLGEPEIEDRWTRLDVLSVDENVTDPEDGSTATRVRGAITFRAILTGSLIMELRVSDAVGAKDVDLRDEADRLDTAHQIMNLMDSSTVIARSSLFVTGFDHLIREHDFVLPANVPDAPSGGAVFAVLYFGQIEEMELPSGEEIEIVTASDFEAEQILPAAFLLRDGGEGEGDGETEGRSS